MKCFKIIVSLLILCSLNVFGQENTIKHTIIKGETISGIAKKYKVSVATIYQINPEAKKTLHLNQILIIPVSQSNTTELSTIPETIVNVYHEVRTDETVYGIAKKYKTTIDALNRANPTLITEGLKIGQNIRIPTTELSPKEIAKLSQTKTVETITAPFTHQVKSKESMYVIAKQYGITMQELSNANPKVDKNKLRLGQLLSIPSNGQPKPELTAVEKENVKPSIAEKEAVALPIYVAINRDSLHEVLPKETKYGIAKQYALTVDELEKLNPDIVENLPVGYKLIIRKSVDNKTETVVETETTDSEKMGAILPKSSRSEEFLDQLVSTASDNIGTRYRSGGTTKSGFDCSGLMCTTFGAFDIKLPRSSYEQSNYGTKVNPGLAQKGDLIFFQTNGRSRINHVGMVVDVIDGEIKFIHSSVHGGVMISSTKETYYNKNFVQVNRVLE